MTWSLEGRKRRGRTDMKWERQVERVMKQNNLTPGRLKPATMAKSD
jgi:hypothetical protein